LIALVPLVDRRCGDSWRHGRVARYAAFGRIVPGQWRARESACIPANNPDRNGPRAGDVRSATGVDVRDLHGADQ
jgi:hypothetical protein